MAFFKVALCLVTCFLHAAVGRSPVESREVTIDSAYTSKTGSLLLMSGDEFMPVNQVTGIGLPPSRWRDAFKLTGIPVVQAAFTSFDDTKFFFYGDHQSCRLNLTAMAYDYTDYSSGKRRFLADGGPDAAGKKGNKRYVFKGCRYAIRHSVTRWSNTKSVKKVGLPCHIDAAWRNGTDMMLLRGDKLWYWREDNSVDGPMDFNSVFQIDRDAKAVRCGCHTAAMLEVSEVMVSEVKELTMLIM